MARKQRPPLVIRPLAVNAVIVLGLFDAEEHLVKEIASGELRVLFPFGAALDELIARFQAGAAAQLPVPITGGGGERDVQADDERKKCAARLDVRAAREACLSDRYAGEGRECESTRLPAGEEGEPFRQREGGDRREG